MPKINKPRRTEGRPGAPKPDVYRCPECRSTKTPVATGETHEDTSGETVERYVCPEPNCDYDEGRPVAK